MTPGALPARYHVSHRTSYAYGLPMADGYTVAYLLPRPTALQEVVAAEVSVTPEPDERSERIDVFGNRVLQIGVHHSHRCSSCWPRARSSWLRAPAAAAGRAVGGRGVAGAGAAGRRCVGRAPVRGQLAVRAARRPGGELRTIAEEAFTPRRPIVDGARDLCRLIYETFEYDPTFTDVSTPLSAVLDGRRGVCQDFAHLADRVPPDARPGRPLRERLHRDRPAAGADRLVGAAASHAWCSVWVPQRAGSTSTRRTTACRRHRHITLAWGRDYGDVAPVRGVVIGPAVDQELSVEVEVTRLRAPRTHCVAGSAARSRQWSARVLCVTAQVPGDLCGDTERQGPAAPGVSWAVKVSVSQCS